MQGERCQEVTPRTGRTEPEDPTQPPPATGGTGSESDRGGGDHPFAGETAARPGETATKARIDEIFALAIARRAAKSQQAAAQPGGTDDADGALVLVSGDLQQARYIRQAGTELDLIVNGPCSVDVRTDGADGALLYQGNLDAGDSVELPSRGSVWLRLGDPQAVTVNADGVAMPIAMPARPAPFDLIFDIAQD